MASTKNKKQKVAIYVILILGFLTLITGVKYYFNFGMADVTFVNLAFAVLFLVLGAVMYHRTVHSYGWSIVGMLFFITGMRQVIYPDPTVNAPLMFCGLCFGLCALFVWLTVRKNTK